MCCTYHAPFVLDAMAAWFDWQVYLGAQQCLWVPWCAPCLPQPAGELPQGADTAKPPA